MIQERIESLEVCSKCGGKCCLRIPGICFPDDFENREAIVEALKSGRYCIDWWEGDPRESHNDYDKAYFVRPAGKGFEGRLKDPTWGGIGCTFHSQAGCALPYEKRPTMCRMLVPSQDFHCNGPEKYSKRSAAVAWLDTDLVNIIHELEVTE